MHAGSEVCNTYIHNIYLISNWRVAIKQTNALEQGYVFKQCHINDRDQYFHFLFFEKKLQTFILCLKYFIFYIVFFSSGKVEDLHAHVNPYLQNVNLDLHDL